MKKNIKKRKEPQSNKTNIYRLKKKSHHRFSFSLFTVSLLLMLLQSKSFFESVYCSFYLLSNIVRIFLIFPAFFHKSRKNVSLELSGVISFHHHHVIISLHFWQNKNSLFHYHFHYFLCHLICMHLFYFCSVSMSLEPKHLVFCFSSQRTSIPISLKLLPFLCIYT